MSDLKMKQEEREMKEEVNVNLIEKDKEFIKCVIVNEVYNILIKGLK